METYILTCRAREPVIGKGKDSEMLWLENPGNYYTPWRPTVIAHGPDIFVIDAVLNTTDGPRDCLIAAQFFTSSLTIYWVDTKIANWTDASKFFYRSGDFKRHSIATGFKPGKSGTGKGAPGAAMPVYPNTKVNGSGTYNLDQEPVQIADEADTEIALMPSEIFDSVSCETSHTIVEELHDQPPCLYPETIIQVNPCNVNVTPHKDENKQSCEKAPSSSFELLLVTPSEQKTLKKKKTRTVLPKAVSGSEMIKILENRKQQKEDEQEMKEKRKIDRELKRKLKEEENAKKEEKKTRKRKEWKKIRNVNYPKNKRNRRNRLLPGFVPSVYLKQTISKPSILLSGDDDGKAYYLEPVSNEPSDWLYSMMMFLDAGDGTVGELSFADVDGDSYVEVFAPSYSTNELFVYRFT
ncbi:unnamed protein product [Mytilus edulis]|uniref:Uncharacterized protein n=1 Tax=Mytilus edulis TaxID=6550 RepID=A0A8S3TQ72_MYTED|nr:unnamed protein product [Mytilus edulis]